MKNIRVFSLTLAALSISMAAAITGCESADGEAVEISASKRDFSVRGESATLTASGWNDYRWSLSDTSIGRLSRETGASVTYTAIDIPAAGTSYKNQTVTCEALDSGGVSGSIVLRHVSEGGTASAEENEKPVQKFEITPSSVAIGRTGQTATLSLKNASAAGIYTWSVISYSTDTGSGTVEENVGRVSPTTTRGTAESVTYTAPSPLPTNVKTAYVQCSDGTQSARCTISFP